MIPKVLISGRGKCPAKNKTKQNKKQKTKKLDGQLASLT